jgi:hypothetical protein
VPDWIATLKPAASYRVQLFLAALAWTAVGAMLLTFGVRWLWARDVKYIALALAVALVLGTIKARTAMRKAATRAIGRIRTRDGKCAAGFFSWKMWLVALFMMAMGQALRHSPIPRHYLGVVYVAVGVALLLGSLFIWRAWYLPVAADAPSA